MMGKYMVRYKGTKVKGKPMMPKADMADEEDMMDQGAADEGQQEQPKGKPFQPEKNIVENMLGKPAKKAKKELGEKGSAKSGNYGHAGIPGHQGGSRPKGSGGTGGPNVKVSTGESLELKRRMLELDDGINRTNDPALKRRWQSERKKLLGEYYKLNPDENPKNSKPAARTADQAKADYIAAHPESVAAHQAAGKPISFTKVGAPGNYNRSSTMWVSKSGDAVHVHYNYEPSSMGMPAKNEYMVQSGKVTSSGPPIGLQDISRSGKAQVFQKPGDAAKYLKDKFGIDWDGKL